MLTFLKVAGTAVLAFVGFLFQRFLASNSKDMRDRQEDNIDQQQTDIINGVIGQQDIDKTRDLGSE